jgi:hypothetical protein
MSLECICGEFAEPRRGRTVQRGISPRGPVDALEFEVDAVTVAATFAVAPAGCGWDTESARPYGATPAHIGESLAVLGWNMSVANLRFVSGHVLIDIDAAAAAPSDRSAARANPAELRFGLYGALARPIETSGFGSCDGIQGADLSALQPLSSPPPERVTGTVCLGPISDQAQVRGVYVYSPRDRIAGTTVAYPAAFPVGLPGTNINDTGLMVSTTSVEAWHANGTPLTPAALGDPTAFSGRGYMLLGLRDDAVAAEYRDESARRGGPMMLLAAPTLPPPGLDPACSAYGDSVLVLPDASLDAVQVDASLCTQGEINTAVLYGTVSVIATHAAVWTTAGEP